MGLYVDIEKKLHGFDLKIKFNSENNVLGLLGASGSGKSMTLRCLAGLENPDKGKIVLNEKVVYDSEKKINLPSGKRKVGFLFQNYALFPNMTVSQNISFALNKMRKQERIQIVNEKIAMMQLQGLEDRFPNQLSGGQQQRVAIARALAVDPELLLLDEPFSALDSHLRSQMEKRLIDTVSKFKGTVVFVSHNRDEIYRICHDIAVVNKGKVSACGNREHIFENPPTLPAAQLTGCKNLSSAKFIDDYTVEAVEWGCIFKVKKKINNPISFVGIRAHYIRMAEPHEEENVIKCYVNSINEGPFTILVYLDNAEKKANAEIKSLQWKISKEKWEAIKSLKQPWNIYIDKEKLFVIE